MYSIKLAEKQYYDSIFQIYKPFITDTIVSFETKIPPAIEFYRRIDDTLIDLPWLVCLLANKVIGYAYASKYRKRAAYQWTVEVSVYIETKHHRRNIGKALYTSLFEILKIQHYKTALAGITLPNQSSVLFHESMGFVKTGEYANIGYKFGKWHNVGWWQKHLGIFESQPTSPLTTNKLRNTPEFKSAINKGLNCIQIQ